MHAVHPDHLKKEDWEGFPFYTLVSPEVGGTVSIYELTVVEARPHKHEGEDQIYIIKSGRGMMQIDDEKQEVGPGELVYIPSGSIHALSPLGDESVVLYSIKHELRAAQG